MLRRANELNRSLLEQPSAKTTFTVQVNEDINIVGINLTVLNAQSGPKRENSDESRHGLACFKVRAGQSEKAQPTPRAR